MNEPEPGEMNFSITVDVGAAKVTKSGESWEDLEDAIWSLYEDGHCFFCPREDPEEEDDTGTEIDDDFDEPPVKEHPEPPGHEEKTR